MLDGWDGPKFLTLVIAVAALGVSLWNSVILYQSKRPKLKVEFSPVTRVLVKGQPVWTHPLQEGTYLRTSAANVGERTVTLEGCSLLLPNGRELVLTPGGPTDPQYPHELEPSKRVEVLRPMVDVAQSLKGSGYEGQVRIVGVYRDATGGEYKSKPLTFDVAGWLDAKAARDAKAAQGDDAQSAPAVPSP